MTSRSPAGNGAKQQAAPWRSRRGTKGAHLCRELGMAGVAGWGRRGEGICISWGVESEPLNADILFFCRLGTSVSESCPPTGGSLRK